MSFDPETAYHNDWEFFDRVESVTWELPGGESHTGLKGRWGAINTPDLVSAAAGLGLSSDAAAVVVWEPKPDDVAVADWQPQFAPTHGHVLRRTDENDEGWMVIVVTRSPFKGKWQILCDKEVLNA